MIMNRLDSMKGEWGKTVVLSNSTGKTVELGKLMGSAVPSGTVISLEGGLGAGKTVMAKGICAGLGVDDEVRSSSFVLAEEYTGDLRVIHFDLYRLEEFQELEDIGFFDYIDGINVVLVEWGDRLPPGTVHVDIRIKMKIEGEETRRIELEAPDRFLKVLDEWNK